MEKSSFSHLCVFDSVKTVNGFNNDSLEKVSENDDSTSKSRSCDMDIHYIPNGETSPSKEGKKTSITLTSASGRNRMLGR